MAPVFVREVLDACEGWEGKDGMPMKLQELMMVLQIETDARRRKNPPPAPSTIRMPQTLELVRIRKDRGTSDGAE